MSPVPPNSEDPSVAEPTPVTPGSGSNSSAEQPSSDAGSVRPSSAAGQSLGWEPPSPEELSRLLPEYEVHELIGAGGMGAVYRATELKLMRPIAMKILLRGVGLDFGFEERFRREARALAELCHPNIVTVYNFGEAGSDYLFLAMEFIQGTSLAHLLADRSLPCQQHLALLPQVCEALEMAHSKGIVHRDIKPANIMVNQAGRVKMLDFGLAKHFDVANSLVTRTGAAMGTPGYAAPEQFEGGPVDHRADLYAMGVLLYRILTGHIPRGIWLPPSEAAKVDPAWDEVAIKALMAEPEARWQSATILREQIEQVLNKRPPAPAPAAAPKAIVTARPQVSEAAKPSSPRPQSAGARSSTAKRGSPARVSAAAKKEKKPATPALMATLLGIALVAGLLLWSPWKKSGGVSAPQPAAQETGRNALIETLEYRDPGGAQPSETKVLDLGGGVKMELVAIPPGEFMMGSTPEERAWAAKPENMNVTAPKAALKRLELEGQQPPRRAVIRNGFWLGRTEVTVGQWRKFAEATGYRTSAETNGSAFACEAKRGTGQVQGAYWRDLKSGAAPQDGHAVTCISWEDATAFCKWFTEAERKSGRLPPGYVMRLPGEAEWEYACRGGKVGTRFWWGDAKEDGEGRLHWCKPSTGRSSVPPVDSFGERGRNGFGLADMLGNVWEWCLDHSDPAGAYVEVFTGSSPDRVLKGGGFESYPLATRCASRDNRPADTADFRYGFRVCCGVDVLGGNAFVKEVAALPAEEQVIDMLGLIDPVRDRIMVKGMGKNHWERRGKSLAYMNSGTYGIIAVPLSIRARCYEFEIAYEREKGRGCINVAVPLDNNRRVPLYFEGPDYKVIDRREGPAWPADSAGSSRVVVRVTRSAGGAPDQLNIRRDALPTFEWQGRLDDFGKDVDNTQYPNVSVASLFLNGDNYVIHTWTLRIIAETPARQSSTSSVGNTDFLQEVAVLPAEQQVARVVEELKKLNPGYNGQEEHIIENGAVTSLTSSTAALQDISPLCAMIGLQRLSFRVPKGAKGAIRDLSPLRGLRLTELIISDESVADLSPLAGMPLKTLNCSKTLVSDLTPLKGMPLQTLMLAVTRVNDLSPLQGMLLTKLQCHVTSVSDFSPLKGAPLRELHCNPALAAEPRNRELLRGIKTLEKINNLPTVEFWRQVDEGKLPTPLRDMR